MTSKLAIVTGSGRGIGAATAELFAKNGMDVCINYKSDSSSAEQLAKTIESYNQRCITIQSDLSTEEGVLKLFHHLDHLKLTPSIVVNNLGILKQQMPLVDISVERWTEIFNTNVLSCYLCCREAIKRMSTKHGGQGGVIVNVSSLASKSGSPNEYIDYAASKGAMDSLTTGLAKEVADEGIRVNAVRPGFIHTDIHADGGEPNRIDRLKPLIPLGRGGTPEEVAEAIFWLCSDKASFNTGCFIDVAGGV